MQTRITSLHTGIWKQGDSARFHSLPPPLLSSSLSSSLFTHFIIFFSALLFPFFLPSIPSPSSLPPSQHSTSPNKAILWGGNEDGPGVFPQKISGPGYNSSFIYVLDLGTGNNASWVRNLATGPQVPRPREGVHFTRDSSGRLYIFGGRTVNK